VCTVAALLVVAVAAVFLGLAVGGGATPEKLQDPGPLVRYGLPIARLVVNLSAAGMLGALVLVLWALSPTEKASARALDMAATSAAVMTVASAVTGFLVFEQITAVPPSFDADFGQKIGQFLTSVELGQAWLATTLLAAASTVLCVAVRNRTALVFVTILAAVSFVPLAQQGHAAGAANHDAAVTALGLHVIFIATWVGGLATVVVIRRDLARDRLVEVVRRYSTLALVCFIIVAISGYVSAAIRMGTVAELGTPYGVLVLLKIGALLALGGFGAIQRTVSIRRMSRSAAARSSPFWVLVTGEGLLMGVASGLATALARTATPGGTAELPGGAQTPASVLTNSPLPPWPDWQRYITEWNFDLLWLIICGFALFFYLAGVWRVRRRGDRWPMYRTVLWVAGIAVLGYTTNGGVNVYEEYLFSSHMAAHMILTMAVPVLLVPGAPITLAMRAIRPRKDGSRGAREWLLFAIHSRVADILTHPLVAAGLFAGSLWLFYYSPLFRWATVDHVGHQWMIVHFLVTGYLFVQSMIGIDPVKQRLSYPFRLLLLLGTMAFHAFFGLALMMGSSLLLPDWYGAMGWGTDALTDQQLGGGIAWGIGEIPTLALAMTVAIRWSRTDERESRRRDRHADRTGDAELRAYNERLVGLAQRDGRAGRGGHE